MIQAPQSLISAVSTRVRDSAGSESSGDLHRVRCRAMSTPVNLVFVTRSPSTARDFRAAAIDFLATFEARYSRFLPDSVIGQINARAGGDWVEVDDDTDRVLDLCDRMHAATRGTFDPAGLPLLRIWDWKASPPRVPGEGQIRAALDLSGWGKVERRPRAVRLPAPGMGLDLGGIGKELAVDQLTALARARGIADLMLDIGQDLRVAGRPPGKDAWYIGLEEPDATPGTCWTAVRLTDHAVATSGDYARSFTVDGTRYGHILDPRTGRPVSNGCQSVSVIAPDCVTAGVLSTAAFILGPHDGLELIRRHPAAEACVTTHDARHQTRRFSSYVPA